jgi:glutamate racemase
VVVVDEPIRMTRRDAAIGVFDSGIGGLTVLRAIQRALPQERYVYLGDTARLPYGAKSAETVTRYAIQATRSLMRYDVKMVVIACNTATAVALPVVRAALDPVPVIGVVDPGAKAAVAASATGRIGVLATEGTVRGGAYVRAIHALKPTALVAQTPCPLFVALAEEGWTEGDVPRLAAERYVRPLVVQEKVDTLVLGCTHFPLLASAIAAAAGPGVTLVDSAETTAAEVRSALSSRGLLSDDASPGGVKFLATDAPGRFARVGAAFLGQSISESDVDLIDLTPVS